jgi:hypothetical protein
LPRRDCETWKSKRANKTDRIKNGAPVAIRFTVAGDFALRGAVIRPIERDYGSATSGQSEAAPARSLFGAKKSGCQKRSGPAGNAQTDKGET